MYPHAMYVQFRDTNILYALSIEGYQQGISAAAFRRLNMKVPYDLIHKSKKYNTHEPYNHTWSIHWRIEDIFSLKDKVEITDPIPLYDFYKMIGYEKETKKFHGKTLRQTIIAGIDASRAKKARTDNAATDPRNSK